MYSHKFNRISGPKFSLWVETILARNQKKAQCVQFCSFEQSGEAPLSTYNTSNLSTCLFSTNDLACIWPSQEIYLQYVPLKTQAKSLSENSRVDKLDVIYSVVYAYRGYSFHLSDLFANKGQKRLDKLLRICYILPIIRID